jgi:hypothetical protein
MSSSFIWKIGFSAQGLRPDFRLLLGSNGRISVVALRSSTLGRQPLWQLVVLAPAGVRFLLF